MKLLLLICLSILGAECAQQIKLQDEDPQHPLQCYNEWENKYYKVGEAMKNKDNSCVRRVCSGLVQDTKMQITEITCQFIKPEGQCQKIQGDPKKTFPQCCPSIKCPNDG